MRQNPPVLHILFGISYSYLLCKESIPGSKQIFPVKELRGHSPNFHIHVSVSDLYIPTINLPILLQEICELILGIYKSLTDTLMCKLGLRQLNSQKEIHKWDFRCSDKFRWDSS
jgi:hypothetical protein